MSDSYYDPGTIDRELMLHIDYMATTECLEQAWDEARDQQPEHLAGLLLDWFQTTPRYDTKFSDWRDEGGSDE